MTDPYPLPDDVRAALSRGDKIEAVKLLRAATGLGLQEAKYLVDRHQQQPGGFSEERAAAARGAVPSSVQEALARGNKIEAVRLYREQAGVGLKEAKDAVDALERTVRLSSSSLAPGEVPPSSNRWLWLIAALAAAGAVAWYLFLAS